MNFFDKYQKQKQEIDELKELRESLPQNKKDKILHKVFESDSIDKLLRKFQKIYHQFSEKLFIKFDLKNELKQGKIFTILIALLIFIYLIITTVFFAIMLNSLIGLNLVFSLVKYSLFFIKWGYTILKNKGSVIQKYLANLFPNSKILKEAKDVKINDLPVFETIVLNDIQNFIEKMDNLNLDIETSKEITLKLKEIVDMLHLSDETFVSDFKSLEYKNEVLNRLNEIQLFLDKMEQKRIQENNLLHVKEDITNQMDLIIERKMEDSKVFRKSL